MSKHIPVVVYDAYGQRKEVGEAAVTQTGDRFFISAKVTDPEIAKLFEIDPKEFSLGRTRDPVNVDFDLNRNSYAYLDEAHAHVFLNQKED